MDFDHLSEKELYDVMAEIADLYYNQGKTQSEIASCYSTNRFRIAKLLQDARSEQIVEIRINHSNERSSVIEKELLQAYPLSSAVVVNTQYSPYVDALMQVGKAGAAHLAHLLNPDTTIGITWGKTIYGVISQLTTTVRNPVTAVQITGSSRQKNPATDSRELVRSIASKYSGSYHYIDAPIYLKNPELRPALLKEPAIQETLAKTRQMDIVLSGIGGLSSLPLTNPAYFPYLTERDQAQTSCCIGSLYGYVLDENGQIADIDLNQKLVSASLPDILTTAHRLVVACGRHKAKVLAKALENRLFNELVTDSDTAMYLLAQKD